MSERFVGKAVCQPFCNSFVVGLLEVPVLVSRVKLTKTVAKWIVPLTEAKFILEVNFIAPAHNLAAEYNCLKVDKLGITLSMLMIPELGPKAFRLWGAPV